MLDRLEPKHRMRLLQFVCSFAWADLEISPEERAFVARLVRRLELEPEDQERVAEWLEVPPSPEAIDPTRIPVAHRKLFLEAIEGVVAADGVVSPEEEEYVSLFQQLLT